MNPTADIADGAQVRSARILIVDDERDNRVLLELVLVREGFLVVSTASGEEALAAVAHQPPDLILVDMLMPGMDGHEVAAKIKSDPATENIRVIIFSALDDRSARMVALTSGADDFFTKPMDRDELCARLRAHLASSRMRLNLGGVEPAATGQPRPGSSPPPENSDDGTSRT